MYSSKVVSQKRFLFKRIVPIVHYYVQTTLHSRPPFHVCIIHSILCTRCPRELQSRLRKTDYRVISVRTSFNTTPIRRHHHRLVLSIVIIIGCYSVYYFLLYIAATGALIRNACRSPLPLAGPATSRTIIDHFHRPCLSWTPLLFSNYDY
jgi:hypothetical protein